MTRIPVFTPKIIIAFFATVLVGLAIVAGLGGLGIAGAGQFGYGTRTLVGATPEEIGRFAQQYAEHNLTVSGGSTQVLLTRAIKRPDLATLGIACLPSSSTIEDPPLTLVILQGQFNAGSGPSTQSIVRLDSSYKYVAYVFDSWSAEPVFFSGSPDGGQFRVALGDPNLPLTGSNAPLVCPADVLQTTTSHYGDTKPGVSQSDIYRTVRSQSFATWSYDVTDNGTGDRHAVINYKHDTVDDLKAYAAANKVLLTQVANFGGQIDIAITFVYPVSVDWFSSWANDNGVVANDSQLRVYGPGPGGQATMSISGKPGDPLPQQSIDNMLFGAMTNNIIGVFGVHGKVDSARLAKLSSEPKVFLVDVTPAWSERDMAQNSIALDQTPLVDFPYGYMEQMGLQNFTDLTLPTIVPLPVGTIIPTIIPPAP